MPRAQRPRHTDTITSNYTEKHIGQKGLNQQNSHLLLQGLSTEFDNRAVHLTKLTENNKHRNGKGLDNESMARTTQVKYIILFITTVCLKV